MFSIAFAYLAILGQQPNKDQIKIYSSSKPAEAQNLSFRQWGGGFIFESKKFGYAGNRSIGIGSKNYFQGGAMVFSQPLDWTAATQDPAQVLQFTYYLANPKVIITKTAKNKVIHAATHEQYDFQKQVRTSTHPKVKQLRLIMATTDGKKSEFYIPVVASQPTTVAGWRTIELPLQAIHGLDATNKQIGSMTFSTDNVATLYVGDMRIVRDDSPINGDVKPKSVNMHPGDQVTFSATADSGLTPIVFRWDFGEGTSIQTDAEGPTIRHRYKKAGIYTVTLTIADRFGYKEPFVKQIPVTVSR